MSPNGWTDDALCAEWFEHAFIPQANAQRTSDAPILLIYDGHGSHATPRLVELALQNNIHLFCLPPHTTHKLQPLDVGVFAQLNAAWKKRCDDIVTDTNSEMRRQDVVREYMDVRNGAVTPDLIKSAFRACGLNPINPNVFGPEDFAPSANTSTHAHLPPTYPCIIQHSTYWITEASSESEEVPVPDEADNNSRDGNFDDLFEDDGEGDSEEVGEGDPFSDEDWLSATDDDILDDDLSTRYEATRPPVIVFRPDGSVMNSTEAQSTVPSSATPDGSESPSSHLSNPSQPSPLSSPAVSESASHSSPSEALAVAAAAIHPPQDVRRTAVRITASLGPPTASETAMQESLKTARSTHTPSHVRFAAYERAVRAQAEQIQHLTAELESATLHASMAALEVEDLQAKLNHKNAQKGGKTRTLVTDSRCFTSGSGRIEWLAQEKARAAKEADKAAKKKARELKAAEQAAVRQGQSYLFRGGLSKQLLPDLQALVEELKISIDPSIKRVTKDILKKEILKFFEEHPERREEDRYRGLFKQAQKRAAPSDETDENEPPSQRRRLDTDAPDTPNPFSPRPSSPLFPHSPPPMHILPPFLTPTHARVISQLPPTPLHGSGIANSVASSSRLTLDSPATGSQASDSFTGGNPSIYSMYHTSDTSRVHTPLPRAYQAPYSQYYSPSPMNIYDTQVPTHSKSLHYHNYPDIASYHPYTRY